MLRLLVPLKFKKIWFIYDFSLSHLLLMVEAHCFLAKKNLHPLSLSEMQCTFKKTKSNDFQRRRAITYKVCSLVRWQWNKFNWLLIFASFPSDIHWHQSSCLYAPSISIQHSLFRRAGSANVSGKDNSLLLSAICTTTSVYNGIIFSLNAR